MRSIGLLLLVSGLTHVALDQSCKLGAADANEPVYQGKPLSDWIASLKDKSPKKRQDAAVAFIQFGPQAKRAIPALILSLKDNNPEVRAFIPLALSSVARELRDSEEKAVLATLIAALKDESYYVRTNVARSIGRFGPNGKAAVEPLIATLKDPVGIVRSFAASALGSIGPEAKAAVPALLIALKDDDSGVRGSAALSLGYIGNESKVAIIPIINLLKDNDERTRGFAAVALGRLTHGSDIAVIPLCAALKDKGETSNPAKVAARALGEIGPAAKFAIPALGECLKRDKTSHLRLHAAASMARIDPEYMKSSLAILIEALSSEKVDVRLNALDALYDIGPTAKEAVPTIIALLKDENDSVRHQAAFSLQIIDPQAALKAGVP